jgi:mono/diheme cytochrome c family protein
MPCLPNKASRIAVFTSMLVATLLPLPLAQAAEPTSQQIEEGVSIYEDFCAMCHGRNMMNTGGFAFDLRQFPKNDFARFRNSVLNGKGGMPAWRDKLTDEDIDLLWAYIGTSSAN